jgi:autoinducer 2-degrading protein
MPQSLYIVQVQVHVKPDAVEAFRAATLVNAQASVKEPGIVRFDLLQWSEDPTRFSLIEVYKQPEAQAAHRETAHYLTWRDAVTDLMAEPRTYVKYQNVFPDDAGW